MYVCTTTRVLLRSLAKLSFSGGRVLRFILTYFGIFNYRDT